MIVRKTLDRHKRRRRLVLLLEEYHRHPALVTGVGAIGGSGRGSLRHGRRHAQEGSTSAARPCSSESAPSMAAVEEARALLVAIGRRRVQGQHEPSEAAAGNEFGL